MLFCVILEEVSSPPRSKFMSGVPQKAINPITEAIARSKQTGIEFCICCGKDMDFPVATQIDDPVRFKDDARYVECAGQVCGPCEKEGSKK